MPHPFDAFNPTPVCYRGDNPVALLHAARLPYNDVAACESFAAQFGGPRAGNQAVERAFGQKFGARNFRFVNNADLQRHAIDHYVTLCEKNRAVKPF
jgi:hypothetical protein